MNGAIAVPSVRTMRVPNNKRNIKMGANHHFLRSLKYSQNSTKIETLDIFYTDELDHLVFFVQRYTKF